MDFGDVMGFAGSSMEGDSARQKGIFGSGLLGRSAMAAKDSSSSLFFDGQQMMISFSSPNAVSSAGVCGPFTPSQWLELEHQALIYKYLDAKVPVPANLLVPIRNTILKPSIFSSYSTIRSSNSMGWPGLNSDPEPGRCRRTDGKKWRCSRDAVADQKYCERHMNRGRHRSRKPVETLSVQPEQKKNRFAMASEHAKSGAFLESSGLSSFTEMKSGNGDFFSDWPETPAYKTLEEDPQVPISIGGPLGEALNQIAAKGTSSSPTGVLPKDAAFCSISGSTAGSPPAESSSCLCDELFGSSLVNSLGFTD